MIFTARRIAAWFWAHRGLTVAIAVALAVAVSCEPYPDGHWG